LQRAHLLKAYPVPPLVLDEWEVSNIFDAEFISATSYSLTRAKEIRRAREAFWSTGVLDPNNYIQPHPPITKQELRSFASFHGPTTQTYACVLPGEIVQRCVEHIQAGLLSPASVLGMEYLVVDEYQDLNPMDLAFVDTLAAEGVTVFVAGDDDQSVYSFRFASPAGIQGFPARHPGCGDHILEGCFRCSERIVEAANDLIENNSPTDRIPKETVSLWETADPRVEGVVHRWRFASHVAEANALASSCQKLLASGVSPSEIMMLLSSRRLFDRIKAAFDEAGVAYTPMREAPWRDTDAGRLALGILRSICNEDDYVALRLILGCPRGVGPVRCHRIVAKSVANNLRYRDLFYDLLPPGVFSAAEATALVRARSACERLTDVTMNDLLDERGGLLRELLVDARSEDEAVGWDQVVSPLPGETTLGELRDYIWADTTDQQGILLGAIRARLGLPTAEAAPSAGVRVMTMHGAKGLQAQVVFIPGLEEELIPGPHRAAAPGLSMEGARLLYVSLTRSRAAAVLSYATRRFSAGSMSTHTASRYCVHLGGPFGYRSDGLSEEEVRTISSTISAMGPTGATEPTLP
jgi:DNA helicase-2/ATP-dependent DNA helicase PcrA